MEKTPLQHSNSNLSIQSSKNAVFSRLFAYLMFKPYVFSLVFALMSRNKGNFYSPPITLSSSLAEVRFASLVA